MERRRSSEFRRKQIAEVTLGLIAQHGLPGVRLAQIAEAVGITDAALYKHFGSKEDILIAAYDVLAARVFRWLESPPGEDAVERLRYVGNTHEALFSRDIDGFNMPMSQFNVWIPRDRLREHVDQTHRALMAALARLVQDGKADGCFRRDTDEEVIVSELFAWIWWEDLSHLRGLDPATITKGSSEMFQRILTSLGVED